jgi:hypothetical protein
MYPQDKITIVYDEFIADLWEHRPRWEVMLSDGVKVYQDDGRNPEDAPAWERLRNYCIKHNLTISSMKIGFRDNIKCLPSDKDGYYFRNMAKCFFGGGSIKKHFIVGYQEGNIIKASIFSVPEVVLDYEEEREIDLEDLSLISKEVVKRNRQAK